SGSRPPGAFTTDLALLVTQVLRREGVTNRAVEFFGPAVDDLTVPERATLANMAPEYGATCGFFAVDARTLDYLRMTGRSDAQVTSCEPNCRRTQLFHDATSQTPRYARIIDIDLAQAAPSMAGPRRPHDRLALSAVADDFRRRLSLPVKDGGFAAKVHDATAH